MPTRPQDVRCWSNLSQNWSISGHMGLVAHAMSAAIMVMMVMVGCVWGSELQGAPQRCGTAGPEVGSRGRSDVWLDTHGPEFDEK